MSLQFGLLDIDLILPEHATFCILMSMPKSKSINFLIYFLIIIFIFIAIYYITSLKQRHLLIWNFLSKVQPQVVA